MIASIAIALLKSSEVSRSSRKKLGRLQVGVNTGTGHGFGDCNNL
jgi:hypothetical protein